MHTKQVLSIKIIIMTWRKKRKKKKDTIKPKYYQFSIKKKKENIKRAVPKTCIRILN